MDLFDGLPDVESPQEELAPGASVLRNFALSSDHAILSALNDVTAKAPFRHMITPGGFRMSVAMTNCGLLGWLSDRTGYRYGPVDPETGQPWPSMPKAFLALATSAAAQAGFSRFMPDSCLINRYQPGTKLSLHQDRNEQDYNQPIVSVSLGIPAVFLFGGLHRANKTTRVRLEHGDVVVWGGPSRLNYHGVLPLKDSHHPLVGAYRFNLTFRKAG